MIWVLAAIVVVTIGVMAVIDASFEGCRHSRANINSLYAEEGVYDDDDIWWRSFTLYWQSRNEGI